jgi:hypothetical protein
LEILAIVAGARPLCSLSQREVEVAERVLADVLVRAEDEIRELSYMKRRLKDLIDRLRSRDLGYLPHLIPEDPDGSWDPQSWHANWERHAWAVREMKWDPQRLFLTLQDECP